MVLQLILHDFYNAFYRVFRLILHTSTELCINPPVLPESQKDCRNPIRQQKIATIITFLGVKFGGFRKNH